VTDARTDGITISMSRVIFTNEGGRAAKTDIVYHLNLDVTVVDA